MVLPRVGPDEALKVAIVVEEGMVARARNLRTQLRYRDEEVSKGVRMHAIQTHTHYGVQTEEYNSLPMAKEALTSFTATHCISGCHHGRVYGLMASPVV